MKKIYFLLTLAFTLPVLSVNAQVGIGVPTPDASAMLDVASTNKGLLLPRIALTGTRDNTTIASPQTSLLIYNTATAGNVNTAVTPGYYYWNGTAWERLIVSSSLSANTWALSGNAGTNPAANFIGTTDDQPLVFKVNSLVAGKLSIIDSNTSWGVSALVNNTTGVYNTAVGANALTSNTTGYDNTANGEEVLYSNTTGSFNTANGYAALSSNTSGDANTANGGDALAFNSTGSYNTAIGGNVLYFNSTGTFNTASGFSALFSNTIGNYNTALGYGADVASGNLSNATAIGYNAKVDASNKVRIGNTAVTRIEGQVLPTTPSDGRFKFNIREDVHGLDFILKLRPITYQFDTKKLEEQMSGRPVSSSASVQASYREATAIRHTGFIAQEVEKAAEATGYNFTGINRPASNKDHYSLSYEAFVMPLVKAVQEQQVEIQDLKKTIIKMQAAFAAQQLKQSKAATPTKKNKTGIHKTNSSPHN